MSGNAGSETDRARNVLRRVREAKDLVRQRGVGSYQSAAVISSTFDIVFNLLEEIAALHCPQEGDCSFEAL